MPKAKSLKLKERDVTRQVRDYLELRGWRPVRINAGPFGKTGMADYLFLHYGRGLILWIEFKAPNGRLSDKQRAWIDGERAHGGTVRVENSLDDFMPWYEKEYGVMGQMRLEAPNA